MKPDFRLPKLLRALFFAALILLSCEKEVEPDVTPGGNISQRNEPTPKAFTADEISDLLVLKNASRITGVPPLPSGGNVLINCSDTIYSVKGTPLGARVEIMHNGLYDMSGFYVAVSNSSFYFDVPVDDEESRDKTDAFIFYIDDVEGMDFPYSFEVTILPHVNGIPVKKFVRLVTIEDPEDEQRCLPTASCDNDCMDWIWEFTTVRDQTGDIHTAYAPGMFIQLSPFDHGGCCWNNISTPSKYDPYCVPANPEYVPVIVDDQYYVRYFESLHLFSDGTYERFMDNADKNYAPDSSNYCTAEVGYIVDRKRTRETGNQSYSSGSDVIYFTVTARENPKDGSNTTSGWSLYGGRILYTCHSLILIQMFNGEEWSSVYRRRAVNFNPIETYSPEYYE